MGVLKRQRSAHVTHTHTLSEIKGAKTMAQRSTVFKRKLNNQHVLADHICLPSHHTKKTKRKISRTLRRNPSSASRSSRHFGKTSRFERSSPSGRLHIRCRPSIPTNLKRYYKQMEEILMQQPSMFNKCHCQPIQCYQPAKA